MQCQANASVLCNAASGRASNGKLVSRCVRHASQRDSGCATVCVSSGWQASSASETQRHFQCSAVQRTAQAFLGRPLSAGVGFTFSPSRTWNLETQLGPAMPMVVGSRLCVLVRALATATGSARCESSTGLSDLRLAACQCKLETTTARSCERPRRRLVDEA